MQEQRSAAAASARGMTLHPIEIAFLFCIVLPPLPRIFILNCARVFSKFVHLLPFSLHAQCFVSIIYIILR